MITPLFILSLLLSPMPIFWAHTLPNTCLGIVFISYTLAISFPYQYLFGWFLFLFFPNACLDMISFFLPHCMFGWYLLPSSSILVWIFMHISSFPITCMGYYLFSSYCMFRWYVSFFSHYLYGCLYLLLKIYIINCNK